MALGIGVGRRLVGAENMQKGGSSFRRVWWWVADSRELEAFHGRERETGGIRSSVPVLAPTGEGPWGCSPGASGLVKSGAAEGRVLVACEAAVNLRDGQF